MLLAVLVFLMIVSCSAEGESEQKASIREPIVDNIDLSNSTTIKPIPEELESEDDEQSISLEEEANEQPSVEESTVEQQVEPEKRRNLPEGFVYLDEVITTATYDMRYYSDYNFIGARMEGYLAPFAIGSLELANALLSASEELEQLGYKFIIYDTYRPAKAVAQFKQWSADTSDTKMKEVFYPNEDKSKLFQNGYLSNRSGHSRGSTADLTIAYIETDEEVDMGSPYDLLDEISQFSTKKITSEQRNNRHLLKKIMEKHGFKAYSKEWWHYVLKNEPYSDTYFDFNIE